MYNQTAAFASYVSSWCSRNAESGGLHIALQVPELHGGWGGRVLDCQNSARLVLHLARGVFVGRCQNPENPAYDR
jgi:hypothetical protein